VRNLAKSPYLSRLPPLLTNRYPPLRLTARIPMSPLKQPSSATPPTATSNASLPGCILRQHTADNDHLQLEPSPHVQIGIIYRETEKVGKRITHYMVSQNRYLEANCVLHQLFSLSRELTCCLR
jgi:hypothetical protein